jgi:hypothetical protein
MTRTLNGEYPFEISPSTCPPHNGGRNCLPCYWRRHQYRPPFVILISTSQAHGPLSARPPLPTYVGLLLQICGVASNRRVNSLAAGCSSCKGRTRQKRPVRNPETPPKACCSCATTILLRKMAGVEGFEPPNGGIKTRCLTTWRHPKKPGCTTIEDAAPAPDLARPTCATPEAASRQSLRQRHGTALSRTRTTPCRSAVRPVAQACRVAAQLPDSVHAPPARSRCVHQPVAARGF